MRFRDRAEAGRRLGARLAEEHFADPIVLGLPRGGVEVAAEVAVALDAPLDVIVVRKLGVPYQPELAMGAIGERGVTVLNQRVLEAGRLTDMQVEAVTARESEELDRRARRFRQDLEPLSLGNRTAVLVDDGIATGATAEAACEVARAMGARRVVLAVPVAPRQGIEDLRRVADDVIALETPADFYAVGQWYDDFGQTTDAEVVSLLERARGGPARWRPRSTPRC